MTNPIDRRHDRIEGLLRQLFPEQQHGSGLSPEEQALVSSLTMPSLKYLNSLYRRADVWANGEVVGGELLAEVLRLNELDRQGLLPDYWWSRHEPLTEPRLRGDPEPEPDVGIGSNDPFPPEPARPVAQDARPAGPAPDSEPSRAPARESDQAPTHTAPLCPPPDGPRVIDFLPKRRR